MRRLLSILLGGFYLYSATVQFRLAIGPQKGVLLGFIALPEPTMALIDFGLALVMLIYGFGIIFTAIWAWYLAFAYQLYALAYVVLNYDIFRQTLAQQHPEMPADAYSSAQWTRIAINVIPIILLFIIRGLYHNDHDTTAS